MNSKNENIMQVFDVVYSELCKWNLRNTVNDNPMAALAFLTFLKFISDNKETLQLEYPEKYNFDYLTLLFQQKIDQDELVDFVSLVEKQLGYENRILASYVAGLDLMNVREQVAALLDYLNRLDLSEPMVAYDSLINFISIQSRKEIRFAGEFITDVGLAKLMAKITEVDDGMRFYDFACGYGISATQSVKGKNVTVYVQDINKISVAVSIILFVLSGVRNAEVRCGDSIKDPINLAYTNKDTFERISVVPPFGIRISDRENFHFSNELSSAYQYYYDFKLSGDLLFTRHLLASLTKEGVGVILLPVGALFRGGNDEKIRRQMIDDNYIDAVIEFPIGVIPGTAVKTALVIFKKHRSSQDIYILDLSKEAAKEYFEKVSKTGLTITEHGIDIISEMVKNRLEVDGLSRRINKEEVLDNQCNLCAGVYMQESIDTAIQVQDITDLVNRNKVLYDKLAHLNVRFNEIIERI